jgi:maltose alpha-D-glucosyltransferase/alpha-amylase
LPLPFGAGRILAGMGLHETWHQHLIMYCLDVETFVDSDGDGVGDFPGLTSRLDYLAALGVTCLWLLPFFPSPNRDDGYDVIDYLGIDPRLGNLADFTEFMAEATERGIKVVIELVPNHTSIDHPWFKQASTDRSSPLHDFYVWRDDDPGDTSDKVIFPGYQSGIWTYAPGVKRWFLHHFYDHQADLNFANPAVRQEFCRIMAFWLQLGVAGFRIDAAPFLLDLTGLDGLEHLENAHTWLQELNAFARGRSANAVLVGEVNLALSKLADYFGGGNELQALFNFPMSRMIFLGLALERADPIAHGLSQLPTIPDTGAWINFLRKHDELNLSQMPSHQQEPIYAAFGPDPDMQIYDRGIRRRLASMLDGDLGRIRLAFSILMSLPGCPVIWYGDEIGMGEDLRLEQRLSVRTPMQWTDQRNGGFSNAKPGQLTRPLIDEGPYGYRQINVASQRSDPESLLNWLASLIRCRRECAELGTARWEILDTGTDSVFAIAFDADDGGKIVILNNLAPNRRTVRLREDRYSPESAYDLFCDRRYRPLAETSGAVTLSGRGYRWLRFLGSDID